jgi:excisionase family DNA binding protein
MVGRNEKQGEGTQSTTLTVGDAAQVLGVTRATLRNWDKAGKLKAHRHPVNGYRLYKREEVEALRDAIRSGSR